MARHPGPYLTNPTGHEAGIWTSEAVGGGVADGPASSATRRSLGPGATQAAKGSWFTHAYVETGTRAALQAAITSLGSNKGTVHVLVPVAINDVDVTVPANVHLHAEHEAIFTVDPGRTLTINGRFTVVGDLRQVFAGTGTVTGTPIIKRVCAAWWYDGTNASTAINAAALLAKGDASRAQCWPLYLGGMGGAITCAGSLNFANARQGWTVYGDGVDNTVLTISGTDAAVEALGSTYLTLRNLSIKTSGNNATAGVLVGGVNSLEVENLRGDWPRFESVRVECNSTACLGAVVDNGGDLLETHGSTTFSSSTGPALALTLNNLLGMTAHFGTLCTATGQSTMIKLHGGVIAGVSGRGIWWDQGACLHATKTFFSVQGSTGEAIYLPGGAGTGGGRNIDLHDCRQESTSSVSSAVIRLGTGASSSGGSISGAYDFIGSLFAGPSGAYVSGYIVDANMQVATGKIVDGGMDVRHSRVKNDANLRATPGTGSWGNTIWGTNDGSAGAADWTGQTNTVIGAFAERHSAPMLLEGGASGSFARAGGIFYAAELLAETGAGTGEQTLNSVTIPANWMADPTNIPRHGLHVHACGYFASNGNAKTIRLKFGGTLLVTNDVTASPNGVQWQLDATLLWAASSAWYTSARMLVGAVPQSAARVRVTADPAATIAIAVTGQDGSDSAGDIALEFMTVEAF